MTERAGHHFTSFHKVHSENEKKKDRKVSSDVQHLTSSWWQVYHLSVH